MTSYVVQVKVAPETLVMVAEFAATALVLYWGIALLLIFTVSDPSLVSSVPVATVILLFTMHDDHADGAVALGDRGVAPVNVPLIGGLTGVASPRTTPALGRRRPPPST